MSSDEKELEKALEEFHAFSPSQAPQSSASHDRCSDVALAKRLRNKRLGIQPPRLFESEKVRKTLRTITMLIGGPWTQVGHPWRELQPEAPRLHTTMGAHVIDFLRDQVVLREHDFTIDGLVYERAVSAMRSEQSLNEVCFFIDGKLALAWNVQIHRAVIERWHEMEEGSKRARAKEVATALSGCVRVHPNDRCEWQAAVVPLTGDVQMRSHVKHTEPFTVWGSLRPNVKLEADELALVAALNTRHFFSAYV